MEVQQDWRWASHSPVLRALTELLKFSTIVELGCGETSTPILANTSATLFCVENSKDWLSLVSTRWASRAHAEFLLHALPEPIDIGTKVPELTDGQKKEIANFYDSLLSSIKPNHPSLLFVDQYTCCRSISINVMGPSFDVVVYHDCEPVGVPWYSYAFDREIKENFEHLYYKTPEVWTGVFIRRGLEVDRLRLGWRAAEETALFAAEHRLDMAGFSFLTEGPSEPA